MFRDSRSRSRSSHSMTSERSNKKEEPPQSSSVYVTFLPEDVTEDEMAEIFQPCGTIKRINIKKKDDGFTFGFVDYDSPRQASRAVEMCHRKKIKSKIINVKLSNPPKKEGGRGFEQKGNRDQRDYGDKKGFGGKKFDDKKRDYDRKGFDNERHERDNRGREGNNRDNRGERKPMKCFKCQEEGHISRNCPGEGGEQRQYDSRPRNQPPSEPQKREKVEMDFDDY